MTPPPAAAAPARRRTSGSRASTARTRSSARSGARPADRRSRSSPCGARRCSPSPRARPAVGGERQNGDCLRWPRGRHTTLAAATLPADHSFVESLPRPRREKIAVTVLLRASAFVGLLELRALFGYLRGISDNTSFPHE